MCNTIAKHLTSIIQRDRRTSCEGSRAGPCRREILWHISSCLPLRGFTLIEVIAVVFIIALMLGLVMPSLSFLGGHKVLSDAKRLAGILRYINDSALGTKKTYRLTADLDRKQLSYEVPEGTRSEQCDTLAAVETHSRGIITAGEVILFFGPLGGQEHLVFYLDDKAKNASAVEFSPLSGRVKISDDNRRAGHASP